MIRGPREGRSKLPGEEEPTDKDPNVKTDVVERGQKHEEDGGEDAANHGDDYQLRREDQSGQECAGKPAQAHP